ncbi:MAG: hypothetical protein IH850_07530 [Acidobacteria bacterium]|nr:hypothetical protein [Acidobacteriota bacterium]
MADIADRFSDTAGDEARWENEGGAVLPYRHRDAIAASRTISGHQLV